MADSDNAEAQKYIDSLSEENDKIRAQIAEVQQQRRAGFREDALLSSADDVEGENARLKQVLEDQQRILRNEEAARNKQSSDTDGSPEERTDVYEQPFTYAEVPELSEPTPPAPPSNSDEADTSADNNEE